MGARVVVAVAFAAACLLALVLVVWPFRPTNALPPCSPNGALTCSTIDAFPLGADFQDCAAQPDPCGPNERLARDALEARDGHGSGIVHSLMYAIDMARVCGPVLCALSGSYAIFVFELADGSRHAIGVDLHRGRRMSRRADATQLDRGVDDCVDTSGPSMRNGADQIDAGRT